MARGFSLDENSFSFFADSAAASPLGLVFAANAAKPTAASPFVSLVNTEQALQSGLTIEPYGSSKQGAFGGTAASRLGGLLCTVRRQSCCPPSLVELTGILTGLAPVEGISVPYTINGVPGAAVTDAQGRYRIIAHPCDNVMVTAPPMDGYLPTPGSYVFTPVCQNRQGLDFAYVPATIFFDVSLASQTRPVYNQPPNRFPFAGEDLLMVEGLVIEIQGAVVQVKFAPGLHDVEYFHTAGEDITATWQSILPLTEDGDYTVYARFADGEERVLSVTAQGLRDGTRERPFLLLNFETAETLNASIPGIGEFTLEYMQGGGSKLASYYELYEDIDMSGRLWQPLGEVIPGFPVEFVSMFTGGVYGNGHKIDNMTPDTTPVVDEYSATGWIACLGGGAEFWDVTLDHYSVTVNPEAIYSIAGGFAAAAYLADGQPVTFSNCAFNGFLSCRSIFGTGGFIGYAPNVSSLVTLRNCQVNAEMIALDEAGGFLGLFSVDTNTDGALLMERCISRGSLTALQQVGGMVGALRSGGSTASVIRYCANLMTVTATSFYGGGIIGVASTTSDSAPILISACFNGADIGSGGGQAGGLMGRMSASATLTQYGLEVTDCYSTGQITGGGSGSDTSGTGGIIGLMDLYGLITRSYATGAVSMNVTPAFGLPHTGGITGRYGVVTSTVALNPSVTTNLGPLARIAPTNRGGASTLDNNLALDTMEVLVDGVPKTPMEIGANLPDGESRTAANLTQQSTYQSDLAWDFTNVWLFGNGGYTLPVLRELPLEWQPTVLPAHL